MGALQEVAKNDQNRLVQFASKRENIRVIFAR
jgi:hypothetical protein